MHLVLVGAQSTIGSAILDHCIDAPDITRLTVLTTKPIPSLEQGDEDGGVGGGKISVVQLSDLGGLTPPVLEKLKGAQACVWAVWDNPNEMIQKKYVQYTHDNPISAAKAFSLLSSRFRFIYVSQDGADPTEKSSSSLSSRIKGRTEVDLLSLAESSHPTLRIYNVRPGYIPSSSSSSSSRNTISEPTSCWKDCLLPYFAPHKLSTSTDRLAAVLVDLAVGDGKEFGEGMLEGVEAQGRTLSNAALRRLAGMEEQ